MITDFLQQHFHEKVSAFLGGGVAVFTPGDIIAKIITGTITGVMIWVATKTIAWVLSKIKNKCNCSCENCKHNV